MARPLALSGLSGTISVQFSELAACAGRWFRLMAAPVGSTGFASARSGLPASGLTAGADALGLAVAARFPLAAALGHGSGDAGASAEASGAGVSVGAADVGVSVGAADVGVSVRAAEVGVSVGASDVGASVGASDVGASVGASDAGVSVGAAAVAAAGEAQLTSAD